jgi:hypothetical protein
MKEKTRFLGKEYEVEEIKGCLAVAIGTIRAQKDNWGKTTVEIMEYLEERNREIDLMYNLK